MENKNNSQLELFTEANRPQKQQNTGFFSAQLRNYEKRITLLIVFIVTGIVCFSLGVERGKRIAFGKVNFRLDTAQKTQPLKIKEAALAMPEQKQQTSSLDYAIQVASFKTKAGAEKEAKQLKKSGLSCLILSKGGYAVLYVGKFPDKESAKSVLTQLKKQYHDCFIRRL